VLTQLERFKHAVFNPLIGRVEEDEEDKDSRRISKNWEMEMVTKATSEDERRHSQASRLLLLDAGEQLDARQRWPQWQRERNMAELFANPVPRP